MPDLYIDVQNAASMLFRLERQGVDVGERWGELADKAEQRIGDCLSAFTLPHWMMALVATGRSGPPTVCSPGCGRSEPAPGPVAEVVREAALPASEAVLAHRQGDHGRAVALMRTALRRMHALGGSHAQQDVLLQLYVDAAAKSSHHDDLETALALAASGRRPAGERVGYAEAALLLAR